MSSIDGWLARKYEIMAQQADAQRRLSGAQAAFYDQQAGTWTADAAAKRALEGAQAFNMQQSGTLHGAQAQAVDIERLLRPALAQNEMDYRSALGADARSRAGLNDVNAETARQGLADQRWTPGAPYVTMLNRHFGVGTSANYMPGATTPAPAPSAPAAKPAAGGALPPYWKPYDAANVGSFAEGVSRVPAAGKAPAKPAKAPKAAKGDAPTDDTVPAVLAPNEAVLNDQAAELLGRPVIDLLNALGTMRRQLSGAGVGMPPALSAQRQAADAAAAGAGAGTLLPSVTET